MLGKNSAGSGTVKEVVIVDDQNLFASGFKSILESLGNIKVTAISKSGDDIEELLALLKPDVLFLDLNLPGRNGLEILRSVRSLFPHMIIAILTMYEDPHLVQRVKENKANAYLSKDASHEELQRIIHALPSDDFYVSCCHAGEKAAQSTIVGDSFTNIALVTAREKEIIQLIAEGKSTEQISAMLFVSAETVKTHRKNIFRKLNLKKVPELVKFAYENHLLKVR